jgi:addiction module HigA family antidote
MVSDPAHGAGVGINGLLTFAKSKFQITHSDGVGRRLPRNRPPTHPGEMVFEEFVKPLELTQTELARRMGVSYPRLNEIIKGRRSVTPDTALRLSRVLGLSADFWLGLQQDWDLWHAMNSPEAKQIDRLKPIHRDQHSFA